MELRPGDRLAHYELVSKVGEGGMGVVWKALDTHLGRTVALKLLPERFAADTARLERFDREARALASVHHPAIVTIYSIEQASDLRFFTMEYVDGQTLTRMVPDAGLPLGTFFPIAEALADAIGAAHAQGITHRDLKPSNVLVTEAGDVKVLDFGIAGVLKARAVSGPNAPTRTRPGPDDVFGTPPFSAPEQLLGHEPDERADLFSLGAVLYFMLAGREPFTADTAAELVAAVLRDDPPALASLRPDAPPRVVEVIAQCLAKRPETRVQTASQLAHALVIARAESPQADRVPLGSVAVLPFDDLSQEKDQDYFCEGIAEEIILSLARISGLRVASRSASFLGKRAFDDRRALAAHLGVEALLEGTVRKAGARLRITVELTDVASQSHLWAERYDRDLEDIFAIQDDIARRVADALCCTLSQLERRALHHRPTPAVQAYDYFLRGRKFLNQYSRKGAEFASRMFTRALDLDRSYARAYAGVAESHAFLYLYGGRHQADLERADEASRRAVELAPESAEAHVGRGVALSLGGNCEAAAAEFRSAITLNPELFDAYYFFARTCFAGGHFDDAITLWEQAGVLRPDDYQSPLLVAQAYEQLGRTADAAEARRRGVAAAEEHLKLTPDDARALYMGANGLVALGRIEEGLAWAQQALALDPEDAMLLYNIGCIYALAGEGERAIDCLERSVTNGLAQREWFLHDPNLDGLRANARFIRLLETIGTAS